MNNFFNVKLWGPKLTLTMYLSLVLFLRPYVQCCRGVHVLSEAILLVTYIVTHSCFNKEIKTAL